MSRYENKLLSAVATPLIIWLVAMSIIYVIIEELTSLGLTAPIYTPNGPVLDSIGRYWAAGTILVFLMLLILAPNPKTALWSYAQLFSVIFISVLLLAIIVFLSGGYLDSPFNGAVSLYIGCFILLQRKGGYPIFTIIIVMLTIFLLLFPYIHLYRSGYSSLQIFNWNPSHTVTCFRLFITFALLFITLGVSYKVDSEIRKIQT